MDPIGKGEYVLQRAELLGRPSCRRPLGAYIRVRDAGAVWYARSIQELPDFRAGESKEGRELKWTEKDRRKPARVVAGSRRRAAASASSSPAAAGAAAGTGACAALSRASAATASSITASAAATPAATATLSVEVGVVRDQVSVETCRLRRNRARAGVDAAESKNEGPRRRR